MKDSDRNPYRAGPRLRRLGALAASLAVLAMAGSVTAVVAGDRLAAGDWFGEFVTHEEEVYQTKYKVRYDEDTDELSITMINLSLSPSKLRDKLDDIEIGDDRISFKIRRKFETKDCRLKSDKNGYRGRCTSDAGEADEFSTISMYPKSAAAKSVSEKVKAKDGDAPVGGGKARDKNRKDKKIEVETREVKAGGRGKKDRD